LRPNRLAILQVEAISRGTTVSDFKDSEILDFGEKYFIVSLLENCRRKGFYTVESLEVPLDDVLWTKTEKGEKYFQNNKFV
jgi:hypothetical protein